MNSTFSNGHDLPPITIESIRKAAAELAANDTERKGFDRITVTRWMPYRSKDEHGRTHMVHGVVINGVLMCSQFLKLAIETETARGPEDVERVKAALAKLMREHVAGWR